MRIREVEVTANVAWSPFSGADSSSSGHALLACGTAAQQLDASFSTSSALEVYSLNLDDSSSAMPRVSSMPVDHRFHKLVWSKAGMEEGARPKGIIIGGLDQGVISLYDADKLMSVGAPSPLIATKDNHTGPVQALDLNPFQNNLLASGASESELFIWDLNKLSGVPMTPGAKSQPLDDVRAVAWNRQVQHILGSCFASRCVVWDLRKNDPIIKVSDSTSRVRCKVLQWHPDVATQLCIASEDDHTPVIQIWDLRLASSPIRTLEGHQRGILDLSWCQQDSDLLMSCGKDNRILCWNPNSNQAGGELLCELSVSNQWAFDMQWCPTNPAIIAAASFDGRVSVHSIMGGQEQPEQTPVAIADSFPGMESVPISRQAQRSSAAPQVQQLRKPPKWLKRPVGARFAFGGRLVTFESTKCNQQQADPSMAGSSIMGSSVFLSRIVTESELVERSLKLETSIESNNLSEFCENKASVSGTSYEDQEVWRFIKANFSQDPRMDFLDLLGYNPAAVSKKVEDTSGVKVPSQPQANSFVQSINVNDLAHDLSVLDTTEDKEGAFEIIAAKEIVREEEEEARTASFRIATGDDGVGLLNRALLVGSLELAVELCLEGGRCADALVLAAKGGPKLVERTQKRYFSKTNSEESNLIRAVATGDWADFAHRADAANWREALVGAVTYADAEQFPAICTALGDRLLNAAGSSARLLHSALLCYICAGDLDNVVQCWLRIKNTDDGPKPLQDLVEVVMTLKHAFSGRREVAFSTGGPLSVKLTQYATLLASQGALSAALSYLGSEEEPSISELRDRLNGALGRKGRQQASQQQQQTNVQHGRLSALRGKSRTISESSQDALGLRDDLFPGSRRHSSGLHSSFLGTPVPPLAQPTQPSASAYSGPSWQQPQTYQPQTYQPQTYQPQAYPQQTFQPAPSVPSVPSVSSWNSVPVPATGTAASLPNSGAGQLVPHVPDQGGPGHLPPSSSGAGWNDPPPTALYAKAKTQPKPVTALTSDPITRPLMMVPQQDAAPPSFGGGFYAPQPQATAAFPSAPGYYGEPGMAAPPPVSYYGDPPSMPSSTFAPAPAMMAPQPSAMMAPQQPSFFTPQAAVPPASMATMESPPSRAAAVPVPEPPKEKAPLQPEHAQIQEVFDGLKNKCLAAANHPQTRRKLEDVGRKLEILYDRLRENALSRSTLDSLTELSSLLAVSDFDAASACFAKTVSGPSFAEIATFMPAVKTLMQLSQQ